MNAYGRYKKDGVSSDSPRTRFLRKGMNQDGKVYVS